MSRFVRPDALVTLPLSGGDTITIRQRLTHGETVAMLTRATRDGAVDRFQAADAVVLAYLVDWTFRTEDGRVESLQALSLDERLDVINNLDQDSYLEIYEAITAHDQALVAARETLKKTVPVPA